MTESRRRGSFEEVMRILKGKEHLETARRELKEGFLAKSSKAAQKTKNGYGRGSLRSKAQRLSTVEKVAAATKAVGWASGDQYINELKLLHVEAVGRSANS